jgi:TM2 domain-containing membrane protein YozV
MSELPASASSTHASHKHKLIAALLAFALGGIGAHRVYLGTRLWWAYSAWLIVGMAIFGAAGSRENAWIVVLALAPVWAGFAECLGTCVMPDANWDSLHNTHSAYSSSNGWNCVFMAIVGLLLGATILVTTIILATQFYYEAQGISFDH